MYLGACEWAWIASAALQFPDDGIQLEDLARYPILMFPAGTPSHEETQRLFRSAGVEARTYTSNSMATITQLVLSGAGVSLMPLIGLTGVIASGALRVLPVKPDLPPFAYWASYLERPGDALPKIAVELAREVAQQDAAD